MDNLQVCVQPIVPTNVTPFCAHNPLGGKSPVFCAATKPDVLILLLRASFALDLPCKPNDNTALHGVFCSLAHLSFFSGL